ncbi:hypothetical protein JXC34_03565 [Candidatus Woesearchaeota archaeon]|nr:hypothetical protein [Candidatus Woesearchaeota archaeon]
MRLFFLFLLLLPSSFAFDCSIFDGTLEESCQSLNEVDEDLIANLIYTNTTFPDHDFISEYNSLIEVENPPDGVILSNAEYIKDAWLKLFTIQPSVNFEGNIVVPEEVEVRSEYDYRIEVPGDFYSNNPVHGQTCKILYNLQTESSQLNIYTDDILKGTDKIDTISIEEDTDITAEATIQCTIRGQFYRWNEYCCDWEGGDCVDWCFECIYDHTTNYPETLILEDTELINKSDHEIVAEFDLKSQYFGTTKGEFRKDNLTNMLISFPQASYKDHDIVYSANFSNKPYYFLVLNALRENDRQATNLVRNNQTLYVSDASACEVSYSDFFTEGTRECNELYEEEEIVDFTLLPYSESWNLLFLLTSFTFICFLIYKAMKKTWGKWLIPTMLMLFMVPFVSADECGLTNLASCIPEKIHDFIIDLLNAPLEPLLELIRSLMENPPSIELFEGIWAIMVYCLSLFFGLLFLYSGFMFLFSGHDVIKREMAKEWLKNTVMMIVLIQASFYLYGLIVELGSVMTSAVLTLVDEHFFLLTIDNLTNIGLEFLLLSAYVIVLLVTLIFLGIRYMVVAFGVIFVPIGIFCYFIPPLKSYGKFILNLLGLNIFITFLASIVILASSLLLEIEIFENIKILVMINCFTIIIWMFILLTKHVIGKSTASDGADKLAQAAKYIAMFA